MTQNRPEASELLDATAEFLIWTVREAVPWEQRFQVLVAAHVCSLVAREIRAGERPRRQDLELFAKLLDREPEEVSSEALGTAVREAQAELSNRLRAGEFDEDLQEVAAALREHVFRKLAVARPGYAPPSAF